MDKGQGTSVRLIEEGCSESVEVVDERHDGLAYDSISEGHNGSTRLIDKGHNDPVNQIGRNTGLTRSIDEEYGSSANQGCESVGQDNVSVGQDNRSNRSNGSNRSNNGLIRQDGKSITQDDKFIGQESGSIKQDSRTIDQDSRSIKQESRSAKQIGSDAKPAGSKLEDHIRTAGPGSCHMQHSQSGPSISGNTLTDQFNLLSRDLPPGDLGADSLDSIISSQQVDLAMLRLAFMQVMGSALKDKLRERLRARFQDRLEGKDLILRENISASELSHLASVISKLHSEERNLYVFGQSGREYKRDEFSYIETLSTEELIELCRREGIAIPDLCEIEVKEEDLT